MIKLVVDTNIIVAIIDNKDVHHKKALTMATEIENNNNPVVLMDCIINEVYSVIARRSNQHGYSFKDAAIKMNAIINTFELVKAYPMVKNLHDNIVKMMIKYDGKLNYHDCLISLVMKEKGLTGILTLDKGFQDVPWIKVIG